MTLYHFVCVDIECVHSTFKWYMHTHTHRAMLEAQDIFGQDFDLSELEGLGRDALGSDEEGGLGEGDDEVISLSYLCVCLSDLCDDDIQRLFSELLCCQCQQWQNPLTSRWSVK